MLASSAMAGATSQRKKEKKKKMEDVKMRNSNDLREYVENDKVCMCVYVNIAPFVLFERHFVSFCSHMHFISGRQFLHRLLQKV